MGKRWDTGDHGSINGYTHGEKTPTPDHGSINGYTHGEKTPPKSGSHPKVVVTDLTALVLIGKRDGKWRVQPTFWLPSEGLREKSVADRVPYDTWARQGYLQTTPGRSISYEFVASHLRGVFRRYDVRKLAFDRWNFKHLLPWLLRAGMSEQWTCPGFVESCGLGIRESWTAVGSKSCAGLRGPDSRKV